MSLRVLAGMLLLCSSLPALAQVQPTPSSFDETVASGTTVTRPLTLTNTAATPVTVRLDAQEVSPETRPLPRASASAVPGASSEQSRRPYAGVSELRDAARLLRADRSAAPMRVSGRATGGARLFGFDTNSSIVEFDPVTGDQRLVTARPEFLDGPEGMAFDGEALYFNAAFSGNQIFKIDPETGAELASITLAEAASFDALAHDGTLLYALDYVQDRVYVIDFEAGTIVRDFFPELGGTGGLTFGGSRETLFVSVGTTIAEVDPADGALINQFETSLGGFPFGLAYSNALGLLFASDVSNDRIVALDPDDGTEVYTFDGVLVSGLAADEAAGVSWIEFDQAEVTIEPGAQAEVQVTFDARALFAGTYAATISVLPDEGEVVAVPVVLNVTGTPQIVVEPRALSFDPIFAGATARKSITVENVGTAALTINAATSTDAAFALDLATPVTVPPDERLTVDVVFQPVAAGPASATLRVGSDDPAAPTVDIAADGVGLDPPVARVSPERLSEALNTGERVERTLVLENLGGADLTGTVTVQQTASPSQGARTAPEVTRTPLPGTVASAQNARRTDAISMRSDIRAASPSVARVLYFADGSTSFAQIERALLGLEVEGVGYLVDYESFVEALTTQSWDLVLVSTPFGQYDFGEVIAFVEGGGRLIMSYWDYDADAALVSALDGEVRQDLDAPVEVNAWGSHPVFTRPNAVPTLSALSDDFFDNGDLFEPVGGAVALAGSTAEPSEGQATLVLGNQGRTLLNGFLWEEYAGRDIDGDAQEDIEELIQNQVAYLMGPAWLSVGPQAFSIEPGGMLDLAATVDASDLDEGRYEADLVVATNDPVSPELVVPVTLDVTGAAVLAVTPAALDFGTLFTGASATQTVTIANVGTAPLTVTALSADDPAVTLDVSTPLTVPPRSQTEVSVTYSPTSPGTLSAALSIQTDAPSDPDALVALSGTAELPPVLTLAPEALAAEVEVGASSSATLALGNTGGADLTYAVTVIPTTGIADAPPTHARNAQHRRHQHRTSASRAAGHHPTRGLQAARTWGTPAGGRLASQSRPLRSGAVAPGLTLPTLIEDPLGDTLEDVDIVEVRARLTAQFLEVEFEFADPVNPANTGGYLSLDTDQDPTTGLPPSFGETGQDIGVELELSLFLLESGVVELLDPAVGVGDPYPAEVDGTVVRTVIPAEALGSPGGIDVSGVVGNASAPTDWFPNNDFATLRAISWLSVEPEAGSVASGTQATLTVTFDASSLVAGTYTADIVIASNDPATPSVTVPVALSVVGQPAIALTPTSLAFGEVYLGFGAEQAVTVSNPGTDVLRVEAIAVSDPVLAVIPEAFDVEPGESALLTIVFDPTEVGDFAGTVTLTTNLAEPTVTIPVTATGAEAPVLQLDTDVVSVMLPANDQAAVDVTLSNTGGSDLTYDIQEGKAGPFFVPDWGRTQEGWNFATRSVQPDPSEGSAVEDQADFHVDGGDFIHPWGTGVRSLGSGPLDGSPVPTDGYEFGVTAQVGGLYAIQTRDGLYAKIRIVELGGAEGGLTFNAVYPVGTTASPRLAATTWLDVTPKSGIVEAGQSEVLSFAFNSAGLPTGTYTTEVLVRTNDPRTPDSVLPVEMNVLVNPAAEDDALPTELALHAPYPNPVRGAAVVAYDLPEPESVSLAVFDVQGRQVVSLADALTPAGRHRVEMGTAGLAAGVYICRLRAGDTTLVQKMLVVR